MLPLNLVNTLKKDYSISDCTLNDLEKCIIKKKVPKNVIIQNELEIAENIFFIESGIVRHYSVYNGKEYTTWFSQEGEFLANSSFFLRKPAYDILITLEECTLYGISNGDFECLCSEHHDFEHFVRLIITEMFISVDEHFTYRNILNAEKKYEILITKYPGFLQRVPLLYLANFLGITPETLSRVRKKISIS